MSILLMEELLLAEVTEEESVLMLLLEDPMLVVDGEGLAVSSTDHGVEIKFIFRFMRCVRSWWCWYWRHKIEIFPRSRWSHPIRDCWVMSVLYSSIVESAGSRSV